jgi:hypothetical protein
VLERFDATRWTNAIGQILLFSMIPTGPGALAAGFRLRQDYMNGQPGKELCSRCAKVDFDKIMNFPESACVNEGLPITSLGTRLVEESCCALCRLFAAVGDYSSRAPASSEDRSCSTSNTVTTYHLCVFSNSTNYRMRQSLARASAKPGLFLGVVSRSAL